MRTLKRAFVFRSNFLIFFLQNINALHSSTHALNNAMQISVNASHSPKSPNQPIHILPTTATTSSTTNSTANLMSTSLNSSQIRSHINANGGGGSGPASCGSSAGLSVLSSSSIHPPSQIMSTSLHSGGNCVFDSNGPSWNSTTSLSPTIPVPHNQRKCEVKLNAMP